MAVSSSTEIARLDDYVEAVAWSPDGARLVAGSMAGQLAIVDATTGDGGPSSLTGHTGGVSAVGWSPDGRTVASGGHDGRAVLHDATTGAVLAEETAPGWVGALAWRPDSQECAAAIGKRVVRLGAGGSVARHEPIDATVTALAWTADGRRLGAGGYGGLWWYENGPEPVKRFEWTGAVLTMAIAPNAKHVATGNQDHTVHCWKLWSASEFQMSGYPAKIQRLAWSPDSRLLAVASLGEVTLWDFSGRGPQGTKPISIDAHDRHLVGLSFVPGHRLSLMTASADGKVRLWEVGRSKARRLDDVQVAGTPAAAVVDPTGRRVALTTAEGAVHVLQVG